MKKSVKFKNNTYLDSTSVVHRKEELYSILEKLNKKYDTDYLGNNPNINELKKSGVYYIYNCTQAPNLDIAVLEVLAYSQDWVLQRFTQISTSSHLFERTFHSGTTWSSWVQRW